MEYLFQNNYLCIMDKKMQILHAAMKLLTEHGLQATPMSAIAKEANTGMGTIYNYYATKEDLINAAYLHIKTDEYKHIFAPFSDDSVKKCFDHFYLGMLQYLIDRPLYFRFIDQYHNSPVINLDTQLAVFKFFNPVVQVLVKGQEQGIIKNIPTEELLQFLNGGLTGFLRWAIANTDKIQANTLQNQLKIAWDAIKA